ncbi:protein MEI2-like 4 isoform X1 [Momordica charantia]|uniref:Protein MEI2-like 4 isoform X1 n=1 Tax=Momordica charantia TaxID=3673 RepID=A0A6J1D5C4_MOMCH|nr:protein MEI2-like 4 isoform X1 [Momordica charantia]XP_022148894.1 protein MEI2-like 4 isoform X1 [Momordica charantia]
MPSEVLDLKGLSSSSYFSDDLRHSDEGQVVVWKSASVPNHRANNVAGASSSVEKLSLGDCLAENSLENHDSFSVRDQNASRILNRHAVGAERTSNYFARSNEVNMMNSQYESSLFSSSLSDIFTRKLRFSPNNALYGHSVDTVASHFEEEEVFESLEELEAQTIGNLLPDDDDLLAGVTDGLDCLVETTGEDDAEDLDFFSNVGGMDLGDDGLSAGQKNSESPGGLFNNLPGIHNGAMAGEHPLGEHPSRTLFVRNINSNVEDSELKVLFEQYGDIRTLYTACKHRGFVMISYYDIRAARNAMKALQNKPLRRRKLDIHYSIPKDNPSEKDINQGTLVVFNLESSVSNEDLRQIFGVYGEIKEIREAPHRSHHKFIEFYDTRAAEAALCALNLSDIAGKQIKLEPSRPGGVRRSLVQQLHPQLEREDIGLYLQQGSPPINCSAGFSGLVPSGTIKSSSMSNGSVLGVHSMIRAPSLETVLHHGISSSVPSSLPSVMRSESIGNQSSFIDSGHSPSQLKLGIRAASAIHPHSLPEHPDGLNNNVHCNSVNTIAGNISLRPPERADSRQLCGVNFNGRSIELNEDVFASGGNRTCPIPGPHYTWGNSYRPQPPGPGVVWPNSPSYLNGISAAHTPTQVHGVPRAASHLMHTVLPMNNHHVGSAPAVNPSIWDRQHAYAGELSKASGFHSGSIGTMNLPNNSPQSMEFFPRIFPQVGGNSVELPISQRNVGLQPHHQRCMVFPGRGQILPMMNSFDSPNERGRNRRNEAASNQADKKQYELDIDRIMRSEDNRTTLMIKNIPNKYTSKMLLAAIDERHRGTYDFIYLPIDFKNKCNVGYAFINMTDPSLIIPFYEAFNGKKWEKFNSEKVASLAYARIQGKAALIAHFQNSSLMNEDKRCRPILFNTDGPNAGDQVPFPMGVNVRTRPGKARTNTHEENHDEGLVISGNGENCSSGDASSSCLVKDLDQAVP